MQEERGVKSTSERRRWRALWSALAALIALSVLCLLIVGPHVFFAYPSTVLRTGGADASLPNNEAIFTPVLLAVTSASPVLAYARANVRVCAIGCAGRRTWHHALAVAALAHHYAWLLLAVAIAAMLLWRTRASFTSPITSWIRHTSSASILAPLPASQP